MSDIITLASVADGVKVALDPSMSMVFPLTACCGASAKGSNSTTGAVCRSCYQEIDASMGMAWIFPEETNFTNVDHNVSEKRRLAQWLAEHGAGPLAPSIAHTIVLETLARAR